MDNYINQRLGEREMPTNVIAELVDEYIKENQSDIFLYSGPIEYTQSCDFVDLICKKNTQHKKAILYLTTPGGDPHAAYRMIRTLRGKYNIVRIAVVGPCKSAGTLMTLGAHELVMSETGELGPLDVQLTKPDELVPNSSGLDIFQALAVATTNAFEAFETCMLDLVSHSGGAISTKTAAEIARDLVVGLYQPITAQVDPNRLGEIRRASQIAHAYAEKLGSANLKNGAIDTLVNRYPSHGFVIDAEEARNLFKTVSAPSPEEAAIAGAFRAWLRQYSTQIKFYDIEELMSRAQEGRKDVQGSDRGTATSAISGRNAGSEKDGQVANRKANGTRPPLRPRSTGASKGNAGRRHSG
jgi:hypothetical protein